MRMWRETAYLRWFGITKVPMIFFCNPSVKELNEKRCVIKIPLMKRTQNHLKSMYFGALCTGADCAGGMIAMWLIRKERAKVSLVFKDFKAEFFKRPEHDVLFTCADGEVIAHAVRQATISPDRVNVTVRVVATTPKKLGDEPVAKFELTLSLKRRG